MLVRFKKVSPGMLACTLLISASASSAAKTDIQIVADLPEFYNLVAKDAHAQMITDKAVWSEGPVCASQGLFLFSDVKQNRVMSWSEKQGLKIWLSPSDFQNGHTIDAQGRIIAASHGKRAIVRQENDGRWITLAEKWQGKRFNSPNDVVVAPDSSVWFTDPTFGLMNKAEGYGGKQEQNGEYVYRYDVVTKNVTKMNTPEVHSPNGLAFSPDGKVLYIADTQLAHDFKNPSLAHHIVAYRVTDGGLSEGRIFAEITPGIPDGIKVDEKGNVWSSSKEGVQVFTAQGKRIGSIKVPSENTGNLALCTSASGDKWLYVTAANLVLRMPVKVNAGTYAQHSTLTADRKAP
ncbi:SMP-30/gluconolactonase/LRE family protein [Erwinia amylovora]